MQIHLTLKSANAKTGPIPVSTSSSTTCPDACPLKSQGCYAKSGPLALHWAAVTKQARGSNFETFTRQIESLPEGTLWRHNQAGDLPGIGDVIDAPMLSQLVDANQGKKGFTYTHKPVLSDAGNAAAVQDANARGFTVNLSANGMGEVDALAGLGIAPVVTVLPLDAPATQYTPAGRKVIVCPAQQREGVSCASCGLCQRRDRSVVVGFRAHGTGARKASAVASVG